MKQPITAMLLAGLLATAAAQAEERTDHFEGETSATLEQAVANFSATNRQLAELLAQPELETSDLGTIHELSYTLENALEKINEEVADMAITLEEVHLGSETGDVERVRANGETYLGAAQTLVP